MSKIKVAIQGELGAYSHIAAERLYKGVDIKTCSTFEETFKQAYNDPSYKIVIPIENSLAGRVADIHYLLPKYKLQIHGEYFLSVEHNLLGKSDATIDDIKYVSDVQLKEDIKLIGRSPSGLNVYNFKYIGGDETYQGVMAQEVPWAASVADNGYLQVDYSKVDVDFKKVN